MTDRIDDLIEEAERKGYNVGAILVNGATYKELPESTAVVVGAGEDAGTFVTHHRSYKGIPAAVSNVNEDDQVRVLCTHTQRTTCCMKGCTLTAAGNILVPIEGSEEAALGVCTLHAELYTTGEIPHEHMTDYHDWKEALEAMT